MGTKKFLFIFLILIPFCNVISVYSSNTGNPEDFDFINDETSFFFVGCTWEGILHSVGDTCFSAYTGRFNFKKNRFVWKNNFSYSGFVPNAAVSETLGHAAILEKSGKIIIRSLLDGKRVASINELDHMYFTLDGKYLLGDDSGHIYYWRTDNYSLEKDIYLEKHLNISRSSWRPDGEQLAYDTSYGEVKIIDLKNYRTVVFIKLQGPYFNEILYSNNSRILLVYNRKEKYNIRLYDTLNYNMIKEIEDNEVLYAKFSHDDKYIITCGYCDKPVDIWEIDSGKLITSISLDNKACGGAGFFKNNNYIYVITGDKKTKVIAIYKLDGKLVKEYKIKSDFLIKAELIYD